MLQDQKPKEMTDYDAAAALLMLSSGGRSSPQAEANNNHSAFLAAKPRMHGSPVNTTTTPQSSPTAVIAVDLTASPVSKVPSHCRPAKTTPRSGSAALLAVDLTASPESKVSSHSKSTRGTTAPKLVPLRKEDLVRSRQKSLLRVQRNEPVEKRPQSAGAVSKYITGLTFSPGSSESESTPVELAEGRRAGGRNSLIYGDPRLGSSSPPDLVHRWDSSRTSSPIVQSSSGLLPSPHSAHESYGELIGGPMAEAAAAVYDSPGMNGFALQLNSKGMIGRGRKYAVSSPEPSPLVAPVASKGERKSRRSYHHPPPCSAGSNVEEKSLNSPTDSGVSSIHDEILQPNLNVQMWAKGSHLGEGLPTLVRTELRKIVDASMINKERFTKTKMINFPLELSFNPNKSRFRKECSNDIDNLDRERNNEASRRSRHKKKLMTHVMSIGLEFDRNENRELYLQERWLTNMIFELEEKALNVGTEAQVLRKLRANCGFQ
uniref:BZIP domain-containing protein n=1 Tax=Anopheles atroparvus TaxID=41427 RepID=A0AAG5DTI4_ANOAO